MVDKNYVDTNAEYNRFVALWRISGSIVVSRSFAIFGFLQGRQLDNPRVRITLFVREVLLNRRALENGDLLCS